MNEIFEFMTLGRKCLLSVSEGERNSFPDLFNLVRDIFNIKQDPIIDMEIKIVQRLSQKSDKLRQVHAKIVTSNTKIEISSSSKNSNGY